MSNQDIAMPEGLSPNGQKAYEAILGVLKRFKATDTGGCKAFYSPAEWRERGEQYGRNAELIVVYDGGDHAPFFSMDADYPHYRCTEAMTEALDKVGLYCEPCTGWYAAIYPGA